MAPVGTRQSALDWGARRYDAASHPYHPLNALGIYGQDYQREKFVQVIARNRVPLESAKILDLGCGGGAWCRFFAEIKGSTEGIVGMDYSADSLRLAQSLSPISYVQGDLVDLGRFTASQFDFVSAFVALMFLSSEEELRGALREAHRVTRPGGFLFISEKEGRHEPDQPYSAWPRARMNSVAEELGFELIDQERLFKRFFGRIDSYNRITYRRMDWFRMAERVLPGRYGYYFLLFRRL